MAFHAADNRRTHPHPVVRDIGRIESLAPITDEDLDEFTLAGRFHLSIDIDEGRAGVLRSVGHRLPRRLDECSQPLGQVDVTHADHLDRDTAFVLDLTAGLGQGGLQRRRPGLVGVEPGAQFTLLTTSKCRHLLGIVGLALDLDTQSNLTDVSPGAGLKLIAPAIGLAV